MERKKKKAPSASQIVPLSDEIVVFYFADLNFLYFFSFFLSWNRRTHRADPSETWKLQNKSQGKYYKLLQVSEGQSSRPDVSWSFITRFTNRDGGPSVNSSTLLRPWCVLHHQHHHLSSPVSKSILRAAWGLNQEQPRRLTDTFLNVSSLKCFCFNVKPSSDE